MSYYMRGDYYPPGHMVGDPFFGFLGGLLKKGVGALTGLVKSKVAPRILGGGEGAIIPSIGGKMRTAGQAAGRMVAKHPVLSAAGAAGAIGAAGMGVHALRGRHPGERRHRRMRVTNTKALRRALRRAYGFERIAMKTIHLLHPKKKARFGGFKKRRRAA